MELFTFDTEGGDLSSSEGVEISENAPLAARLRPDNLSEVLGQDHLISEGTPLRRLLDGLPGAPPSIILYGPPGVGKTSLALLLSKGRRFRQLSAVNAGVKDVREEIESARFQLAHKGIQTLLFIDEVHRFNKAQQDALLPAVEDKLITLVAATTENPAFSIISPLLSRSLVLTLNALNEESAEKLIERALLDPKGLNNKIEIDQDAKSELIKISNGDGRRILTYLEAAAGASQDSGVITVDNLAKAVSQAIVLYNVDQHYDVISAYIKSMRGSDVDAALHYLARMIEAGEDPRYMARRLMIFASEDIGMADSNALLVATSAAQAVALVGMPEGALLLAHATVYCATAPKSNAVNIAISEARQDVNSGNIGLVPPPLRDGATPFGASGDYRYPHDYPEGVVAAQYAPDPLIGKQYYRPTLHGAEARVAKALERIREILGGSK
ncbi:MAG: replication-associated recombination protein A [Candidatus Nanopelagicaceae bacterium]|nr:replication-associated recombination protein A [Candidatus Nanopelagicaceae bacterium]